MAYKVVVFFMLSPWKDSCPHDDERDGSQFTWHLDISSSLRAPGLFRFHFVGSGAHYLFRRCREHIVSINFGDRDYQLRTYDESETQKRQKSLTLGQL